MVVLSLVSCWCVISFPVACSCASRFSGVPSSLLGGSFSTAGFNGGDAISAVGDSGNKVFDSLVQVGCSVRWGNVENVGPLTL